MSGFIIEGFSSSSIDIIRSLNRDDLSKDLQGMNLDAKDDLPYERALGVTWRTTEDVFAFRLNLCKQPESRNIVNNFLLL